MSVEPNIEIEQLLAVIHRIEARIVKLISKACLSEEEKSYILEHIVIIPGRTDLISTNVYEYFHDPE